MKKEKFKRKCPNCGKFIFYNCKYTRNKARKKNRTCGSCRSSLQMKNPTTRLKRITSLKLVKHYWHNKIANIRMKNGTYKMSEETKEKHRINKIERMIKEGILIWPSFNKEACRIFEQLETDLCLDGFYATKGKEKRIGRFWVDYYEPNKNIVIEYDEPYHFGIGGNLRDKDTKRQKWIEEKLGCKFYRINQKTNYEQFKHFLFSDL